MRLIGSLLEQSSREELTISWVGLRRPENRLLSIIEAQVGLISSAFVLNWTPEESEDFYVILVNDSSVVFLEVGRSNGDLVKFESIGVKEYERSLRSRQQRIRFWVALDLACHVK
ncbi:hypothetical protein [Achromobacter denitrificans]|uniref:Uncharacterized protein n=1 Tax=Achromobacter denitrificans TaxID=32002 RepID=A0ABZ3GEF8_ACHDE